jgi:hypothetical protein
MSIIFLSAENDSTNQETSNLVNQTKKSLAHALICLYPAKLKQWYLERFELSKTMTICDLDRLDLLKSRLVLQVW